MSAVGWKSAFDAQSSKPYWYHDDGRTVWEDPTGGAVPPEGSAPMGGAMPGGPQNQWAVANSAGVRPVARFSCCEDGLPGDCFSEFCLGWCCGCISFGQTMERAGLMSCCAAGCLIAGVPL